MTIRMSISSTPFEPRRSTAFEFLRKSGHGDDQRQALKELRKELNAYWDTTADGSGLDSRAKTRPAIDLAGSTRPPARGDFRAGRADRAIADRQFHARAAAHHHRRSKTSGRRLPELPGFALLLGLAIVGLTLARVTALERQSKTAESELRLLSGQIRTTQEQERKYLSRELHDQVGQLLTGLRMELAGMTRLTAIRTASWIRESPAPRAPSSRPCRWSATSRCCCGRRCWTTWD